MRRPGVPPRVFRRAFWARAFVLWLPLVLLSPFESFADDAAQARFHDRRARTFYRKGQFERALREFFRVRRLSSEAQTLFNIGLCFDQLSEPEGAFFYFSRFLDASRPEDGRRGYARSAVERLRPQVGRLVVTSEPPGAEVYIDREEHGSWGQTPLTVPLSPGKHELWISKSGFERASRSIQARQGEEATAHAVLVPILGTLSVTTSTAAEVLISSPEGDIVQSGRAPLEVELTPKIYVVEVSRPGWVTKRVVATVVRDEARAVHVALEPPPAPTGEVTVTSNLPGALIEVDGEPAAFAPALLPEIPLGMRQLRISHDGVLDWKGKVEVRQAGRGYVAATLRPRPTTQRSVWTWITGGIGISSLGAAIATGVVALNTEQSFNASPSEDLKNQGETFAAVTDGLLIVGGLSLATSIILYFATAEQTEPSQASVTWSDP